MITSKSFTELTVPVVLASSDTGRALESLADRAVRPPVTTAPLASAMEPEESLIADVRGNWTPRQMVERKLMALSYTCRPGCFSRTHDGAEARPRAR